MAPIQCISVCPAALFEGMVMQLRDGVHTAAGSNGADAYLLTADRVMPDRHSTFWYAIEVAVARRKSKELLLLLLLLPPPPLLLLLLQL